MSTLSKLSNDKNAKWTVHDSRVNLAALLNDPRKVKRDYDLFTKSWGETFRELPSGNFYFKITSTYQLFLISIN